MWLFNLSPAEVANFSSKFEGFARSLLLKRFAELEHFGMMGLAGELDSQ